MQPPCIAPCNQTDNAWKAPLHSLPTPEKFQWSVLLSPSSGLQPPWTTGVGSLPDVAWGLGSSTGASPGRSCIAKPLYAQAFAGETCRAGLAGCWGEG